MASYALNSVFQFLSILWLSIPTPGALRNVASGQWAKWESVEACERCNIQDSSLEVLHFMFALIHCPESSHMDTTKYKKIKKCGLSMGSRRRRGKIEWTLNYLPQTLTSQCCWGFVKNEYAWHRVGAQLMLVYKVTGFGWAIIALFIKRPNHVSGTGLCLVPEPPNNHTKPEDYLFFTEEKTNTQRG